MGVDCKRAARGERQLLQATNLIRGHVDEHRVVATAILLRLLCRLLRVVGLALERGCQRVIEHRQARLGRHAASRSRNRRTQCKRRGLITRIVPAYGGIWRRRSRGVRELLHRYLPYYDAYIANFPKTKYRKWGYSGDSRELRRHELYS